MRATRGRGGRRPGRRGPPPASRPWAPRLHTGWEARTAGGSRERCVRTRSVPLGPTRPRSAPLGPTRPRSVPLGPTWPRLAPPAAGEQRGGSRCPRVGAALPAVFQVNPGARHFTPELPRVGPRAPRAGPGRSRSPSQEAGVPPGPDPARTRPARGRSAPQRPSRASGSGGRALAPAERCPPALLAWPAVARTVPQHEVTDGIPAQRLPGEARLCPHRPCGGRRCGDGAEGGGQLGAKAPWRA